MNVITKKIYIFAAEEIGAQLKELQSLWEDLSKISPQEFSYKLLRWNDTTTKVIGKYLGIEEQKRFERLTKVIFKNFEQEGENLSIAQIKERFEAYLKTLLDTVISRPELIVISTNSTVQVKATKLEIPEKITMNWLWKHVPIKFWISLFGILGIDFLLGLGLAQTQTGRDIIETLRSIYK